MPKEDINKAKGKKNKGNKEQNLLGLNKKKRFN